MTDRILFILVLFFGVVANAQIPTTEVGVDVSVFPQEKVALSINDNVLLAGELLQYKSYVLDHSNKPSNLSKLVYVSMRNEADSIVFTHKLRVENGNANGDFFIPSSLNTGVYSLIAYTNFSLNNAENAFDEKKIQVINTFVKTEVASQVTDTLKLNLLSVNPNEISGLTDNSETIRINTDKKEYGLREKVNLNIEPSNQLNGNFTLSVRKITPINVSGKISKSKRIDSSDKFYIPELRGELISGRVLSKTDKNPAANKTVSLTIPGEDYVFKLAKTNAQGRFFFSITEGYHADESIIQLYETQGSDTDYAIYLDKKRLNLEKNDRTFLRLDPSLKNWLETRSVQMQIENAYFDVKKDSVLDLDNTPPFYDHLGTLFLLDDYTRFPSIRETFIEVVSLAAIRGSEDNYRFSVNNAYDPNRLAKFNDLPPLVLMDGMLVQDNNEVVNFNSRAVHSIRVITQPYRYGPKIYSGVIAIETKSGDFVPNLSKKYVETIKLPPAVGEKYSYSPQYKTGNTLSRIPDYRAQLLWEPKLNLSNGMYSTSFYTSDVPGTYRIHLQGYTEEGKYISLKKYIYIVE
ncbi:hypothetical protein [Aequorivita marina]|uniref:hypothetical protein n=1 Tax=Aequorivita marina TaxID=3073654 RepID=UPI00287638E5|nr:hypothetical protein [Aequorivita sp. S2608]MDS1298800.1 hypothetical protein [Aequorivita sp. S2608]